MFFDLIRALVDSHVRFCIIVKSLTDMRILFTTFPDGGFDGNCCLFIRRSLCDQFFLGLIYYFVVCIIYTSNSMWLASSIGSPSAL